MHRHASPCLACLVLVAACHRAETAPPTAETRMDAAPVGAAPLNPDDPNALSSMPGSIAEVSPALTLAGTGGAEVAWTSHQHGQPDVVRARLSRDGGRTWEPTQALVAPDGRASSSPALASDPAGNVYLAFLGSRDGDAGPVDTRIYVARAEAESGVFESPVEVSGSLRNGMTVSRPTIAITGAGKALVTWSFTSDGGDGVGIAESPNGLKWTRGVVIERIDLKARSPYVCASAHGNRAWVAYLDSESGVRLRASDDGGSTWSPARVATVSPHEDRPLVAEQSPVCAGDNENVVVAYARTRQPVDAGAGMMLGSSVVVAWSADGGRSFDGRKAYDAAATPILFPQIAREPDGVADVAFYASGAAHDPGALRHVRVVDEKGAVASSKVLRDNFRFVTDSSDAAWPGSQFGFGFRDGIVYAASVDNSGDQPHVVFTHAPAR